MERIKRTIQIWVWTSLCLFYYSHSSKENRFGDDDLDSPFIWKAKEGQEAATMSEKQLVLKRVWK